MSKILVASIFLIFGICSTDSANAKSVVAIMDSYDGRIKITEALELQDGADSIDFVVLSKDLGRFRSQGFDSSIECSISSYNEPEIRACLYSILFQRRAIDAITMASRKEKLVMMISQFRKEFNILNGLTPEIAVNFYDKFVMKDSILAAKIPTAAMASADADSVDKFIQNHAFPIVLKPRRESGAVGVRVLTNYQDVADSLSIINPDEYMVEKFVAGSTYRVDGVLFRGSIQSMAAFQDKPSCYEYYVKRLPQVEELVTNPNELTEIRVITENSIKALGLTDGVFHLELIKNPETGFNFLEIAARPGGGGARKLLVTQYNTDFCVDMMRIDTGLKPLSQGKKLDFGMAVIIPTPGRSRSYIFGGINTEELPKVSSLVNIEVPQVGTALSEYDSISLYFLGANEDQVRTEYRAVMDRIRLEFLE